MRQALAWPAASRSGTVCGIPRLGEAERCASPDDESRAGEMRGRRGRSRDVNEVDRLGDHGPRRHLDHDAVLHQSRVQAKRWNPARQDLAKPTARSDRTALRSAPRRASAPLVRRAKHRIIPARRSHRPKRYAAPASAAAANSLRSASIVARPGPRQAARHRA